jgi:osmotically-inducible protein OsmY
MATAAARTDREICEDVLQELRRNTGADEQEIGVEIEKGLAILRGIVDSYAKKFAVQEAAHRVAGVLRVQNDICVKPPKSLTRSDTEIARATRLALEWDVFVKEERILSSVSDGWVTLDGEVPTFAEKDDAERVVRALIGVAGVNNRLTVTLTPDAARPRRGVVHAGSRQRGEELAYL